MNQLDVPTPEALQLAGKAKLWALNQTDWKLWASQQKLYQRLLSCWGEGPFVGLCHRNFGKSTVLVKVADNCCRKYICDCAIITDTKEHALKIVDEKFEEFFEDCPSHLRPVPLESKYAWRYPNGSRIWCYGADMHRHIKTLRGLALYFCGMDEAGHIEGTSGWTLLKIIKRIVLPALAKHLKTHPERPGHLALMTTSPEDLGHAFWDVMHDAEHSGRGFRMPLSLNPDFDDSYRAARQKEMGGADSPDYLLEYECREIGDPRLIVLPNVTPERLAGLDGKPALKQTVPILRNREWYVGLDIGGKHLTGYVLGHYEPETDTVRIAREIASRNVSPFEFAVEVLKLEGSVFGVRERLAFENDLLNLDGMKREQRVLIPKKHILYPRHFERWADNNNLWLLYSLTTDYGIHFTATAKDQKMAQIGALRRIISAGQLWVDPSCVVLLDTLPKAKWKDTGKTDAGFAEDPKIGHADLLDGLIYFVRNVKRRAYPEELPELQMQVPGFSPPLQPWQQPELGQGARQMAELLNADPLDGEELD